MTIVNNFLSHSGFLNLSHYSPTTIELRTLRKGLSFVPMPTYSCHIYFTSAVQNSLNNYFRLLRLRWNFRYKNNNEDQRSLLNKKLYIKNLAYQPPSGSIALETYISKTQTLINSVISNISSCSHSNISTNDMKIIYAMSARPDIVLAKADKNLGIVLMNTNDYKDECYRHLLDTNTYVELSSDNAIHQTLFFFDLQNSLMLSYPTIFEKHRNYLTINQNNWNFANFYLLMKIHKKPILGRPIIASCTWATTALSKWIDFTLRPIISKIPTILRDTISLIKQLEINTFPSNIYLVSLDVKNMYPSIPIMDGINRVCNIASRFLDTTTLKALKNALELVLNNNICNFENRYFHQKCGTAMGTPSAPNYANLFMADLEETFIQTWTNLGLLLYQRFLDDIFGIFACSFDDVNKFIENFNNLHPSIKVSGIISSSNIDFLDLHIFKGSRFKSDSKLDINLFTKPMNQFLYLPFTSFHPGANKKGFIIGELTRYIRNCSSYEDFITMKLRFTEKLRYRGFPLSFIQNACSQVNYSDRFNLLFPPTSKLKKSFIPFLFNIKFDAYSVNVNFKKLLLTHWNLLSEDEEHRSVFFETPIVSYSRGLNLGEKLPIANRKFRSAL
jgi:hypothetical protein